MSVLAAPPSLLPPPASPGGGKDPKEKPDTDNAPEAFNPWKDIPPVQAFPRLGMFLVPGNGPGTYSLCEHEAEFVREKPPAFPYPPFALQPPSGFDADFRYLDRPDNTQHDYFDLLRRMRPHPDTMLTLGGQASVRHMHESDARLTELNTQYWLFRTRGWADVWYQDKFRLYGEFISALIRHNDLPPLPIDENQFDALNLFAELKVAEFGGNPAYVRVGRQELLFGSQRLVSTLDWANTRRTFEGVRGYWRSEGFDVDAFWTRPVEIRPSEFDRADMNVQFYGAWATLRPAKGQFMDVYYLGLTDERPVRDRFLPEGEVPRGTQEYHTFGARYAGNQGPFLYDFEGMLQCGQYVNRVHHAYAYTASVGWEFQNVRWRPQAWIGYDYASGTSNPAADGKSRTFNQLFAFGHYYFGYLDLVGRRNVEDLSLQLAAYPEHWITLVAQCHHFRLAQSRDSLYNAAGIPTRRSPTGEAGRDVGTEVDLLANIHLSAHSDLLVGYSRLFAGDFIRQTGADVSPQLVYAMYNYRW